VISDAQKLTLRQDAERLLRIDFGRRARTAVVDDKPAERGAGDLAAWSVVNPPREMD
jgi:hypothetical protein